MVPNPIRDGIDHINIYSEGKTAVGRWMSNFARVPIQIGGITFASIESYWYWLACHDDRLPPMYGYEAKALGKKICGNAARILSDTPEFQEKIRAALIEKCRQCPGMVILIRQSKLPLTHYYVFAGQPRLADFGWLINFWREVRDGAIDLG